MRVNSSVTLLPRRRQPVVAAGRHPAQVPDERPEVVLFTFDAGGGHRATANALVAGAEERRAPFRFDVVSLAEVLSPLDLGRRLTGRTLEQTYNDMVRRRQTRFLVPLLRALQWTVRRMRTPLARLLADDLRRRHPAAVLSVIPNFNAVIAEGVQRSHPGVPFLVLLTDFADFPPHFWMDRGVDGVIAATDEAVRQARALGLGEERVFRTSGMVLSPRFYPRAGPARRAEARKSLGLGPADVAVLVLFGGKGSPEMRPLCAALLRAAASWHVVAVCGDNEHLYQSLADLTATAGGRLHRLGFADNVADLMAACDLLLTKPGPGSLAEAFHQRIPSVVCCNARTIPQERYNVRLLVEQELGLAVADWREMALAAARLAADPSRLALLRRNLSALPDNRGLDEVLDLVGNLVARRHGVPAA